MPQSVFSRKLYILRHRECGEYRRGLLVWKFDQLRYFVSAFFLGTTSMLMLASQERQYTRFGVCHWRSWGEQLLQL